MSLAVQHDASQTFPVHVCYDCTNQLIVAHQFYLKLQKADQYYADRNDSNKECIIRPALSPNIDLGLMDDDTSTECISSGGHDLSATHQTTHEEMSPHDEDDIHLPAPSPISRHKPNIIVSNTLAALLNKSGAVTSQQVRHDVAASRKRKHTIDDCAESTVSAKRTHHDRNHIGAPPPPKHLMVPQFVITEQPAKSPANDPCIKHLDLICVRVTVAALKRLNLSDVATNLADHPVSPKSIFMCKLCPKAYASSHHLILHTRKSHICQFCLRSYAQTDHLFEHIRTEHVLFACPLCAKQFQCNSNLRSHLKRTHDIQLPAHMSLMTESLLSASEGVIEIEVAEEDE